MDLTYDESRAVVVRFSDGPHGYGQIVSPVPDEHVLHDKGNSVIAEITHPGGEVITRTIWVQGLELVFG